MFGLAKKFFGSENDRKLKKLRPIVDHINGLEPEFEAMTDDALKAKTAEFRQRFADGASLDDLLPEAFATVREAAKRTLGQRHYDVQLIGGITLHRGEIAEMRTGEGKTLVSTLAAYLNALAGKGVHIVTVNEYLARRDSEWMGKIYEFLGLTVGCINNHEGWDPNRQSAYRCDITYGTNNEFGFDYLRDNMKYSIVEMLQRDHAYAIIDEIDSILIDEARTPLIISGPTDDRSEFYTAIDAIIPRIEEDGYELDEKRRTATFNEEGNEQIEGILRELDLLKGESLYDIENVTIVHHINQGLKAHKLFIRDKDYIVKNGQVVLIDEFTGRMMDGRRLSDGLHQAIEAKEKVEIKPENVTLASVTLQNYFRLYDKLSGMTGTAETEASEFADIYELEVLVIPTNRPIQRIDEDDVIYRTEREKFSAIIDEIRECQKLGQPVLVGTVSIEKSERLSETLKQAGIEHQVLNARFHEQEASIVAQAGVPGTITIATNMAGRGTDIQLGGNPEMQLEMEVLAGRADEMEARIKDQINEVYESRKGQVPPGQHKAFKENLQQQIAPQIHAEVGAAVREEIESGKHAKRAEEILSETQGLKQQALDAGGLYVLGTERHESRRIDNQLRGRTGRQGDPGRSKFYLSTEDDLMRIFGGDRLKNMMGKMGWEEGENLTNRFMSKAVERAQVKVEQRNFDIRKDLLKYDDVMNDQRKTIFEQRLEFMRDEDVSDVIEDFRHQVCEDLIAQYVPKKAFAEQWDLDGLAEKTREILLMDLPFKEWASEEGIADEEMLERLRTTADKMAAELSATVDKDAYRGAEKEVLLKVIDTNWREHLQHLDALKSVVGLRAHGQRDPLHEYKSEAFTLFDKLLTDLRDGVTTAINRLLINVQVQRQQEKQKRDAEAAATARSPMEMVTQSAPSVAAGGETADLAPDALKGVSRNAPCPCGSGKKVKHCHGKA
ncbi:MAG: preprotein translocase subunit SecA [Hellea sp.]|nr:preprotein translocase subunit SecA [Hellea sp.]